MFSGDDFLVCSQRETESNFLRRNSLIDLTSGTKNEARRGVNLVASIAQSLPKNKRIVRTDHHS